MNNLRKPFGTSRREIWRQLCDEIHEQYVGGGFWNGEKVQATDGEWTVTLDTVLVMAGKVPVEFTRMRAPYVNHERFRFTIYRGSLFSEVAKWFGMQDIETGDAAFDRDFIVKGTNDATLRKMFESERLRALVTAQPEIHLTVKDDEGWFDGAFAEDVDELCLSASGAIKDVERLREYYELFGEALEELCRISPAYKKGE